MLRSSPCRKPSRAARSRGPRCGGKSSVTLRSPLGRVWQASRTPSGALMRSSTRISSSDGGSRAFSSASTRTRQVEQRPRPPQTEAWGLPAARLISKIELPGAAVTLRAP